MNKDKTKILVRDAHYCCTFPPIADTLNNNSSSSYEDYLNTLQERNRIRRKLKKKSQKQLALERREKGFTLYLNGANAEKEKNISPIICRKAREGLNFNSKTVSPRTGRKNWLLQTLDIKTEDGTNVRLSPNVKSFHHRIGRSFCYSSEDSLNTYYTGSDENADENESEEEIEEQILTSSESDSNELSSTYSNPELSSACYWNNRKNVNLNNDLIKDDDKINSNSLIELQSEPIRVTSRLLSATSIKPLASVVDTEVMEDVLQAIRKENQTIEKNLKSAYEEKLDVNPREKFNLSVVQASSAETIVTLEILSNWGHPSRVGLTEVQFLDDHKNLIEVTNVTVSGTSDQKGLLRNLHNNKTKTVKERYMWSCVHHSNLINLTFNIRQEPSSIKIWNFNHSIKDLLIGVRQAIISLNGKLIFNGILDKACGNQVFDYSQTIFVHEPKNTLIQSPDLISTMDRINQEIDLTDSGRSVSAKISERSFKVTTDQSERRTQSGVIGKREESELCKNTSINDGSHIKSSISLYNCPNRSKPKWLEKYPKDEGVNAGEKPSWLKGLDINMKEPFVEPIDNSRNNSRVNSGSHRPRRYDSEPLIDLSGLEDEISKSIPLLLDEDDARPSREGSARYGRRAIPTPTPSSGDPRKGQIGPLKDDLIREESARTRTRRSVDKNLEESWTSLHMFNQHHRGRLSINMEGDVLDSYLNTEKIPKTMSPPSELDDVMSIGSTNSDFIIPELPEGQHMILNIKTTWGDTHYVGLNGVEIFASTGESVKVHKITANPADINILPEYSKDPRVVSNLIDDVYRTRDDMHLWLTPFTAGKDHLIFMLFEKYIKIAMIRIWNYNKSRIHSFRGAKDVEISLDKKCIFRGEIARACGGIQGGIEAFGDTILFTTDEDILENIAKHDGTFSSYTTVSAESGKDDIFFERPPTGHILADGERPMTCAVERKGGVKDWEDYLQDVNFKSFKGQVLELKALCNWGDPQWIGLTGLEVLDEVGDVMNVTPTYLSTPICDLTATKTLQRLVDGDNVTTQENHMWLAPYIDSLEFKFIIAFPKTVQISGVRLWNYNSNPEESYRGVKFCQILFDGKLLSPSEGFLIRKGPGNVHFDFAQEVNFAGPPEFSLLTSTSSRISDRYYGMDNVITQDYEAPVMPRGFIFQLQLYSTWGDPYYVGLNGLEMYDAVGNKIPLTENNIAAYPDSVNVLDNVTDDVRTPDKLIDGVNDTLNGHHMWLAPVLPCVLNRIYIVFDYPVTVSMIKIWNYAKTANRGTKEFGLLVDDLLVYHNTLDQFSPMDVKRKNVTVPYHTILFTADKDIALQERNSILKSSHLDQDVQLTNDCEVVHRGTSGKIVDQALRPMTSLTSIN